MQINNVNDLRLHLNSNQIKGVYFQIVENVQGYFQFKELTETNLKPLQSQNWDGLEGSPTDAGKYNSNKPIYEGSFSIITEQEIDIDWFKEKLDGYIASAEMFDYEDDDHFEYDTFSYRFLEYGRDFDSVGFDANSEMGLFGNGIKWSRRNSILSSSFNPNDIETGKVYRSDGEETKWRFVRE